MTQSTHNTSTTGQNMANISFSEGYWFYFNVDDIDIAVHGSAWSGKETVYVNDNPVSEQRVVTRFSSEHNFVIKGKKYTVTLNMISVWRGEVECSLYVEGELYGKNRRAFMAKKQSWKTALPTIAVFFVGGMVAGYLVVKLIMYFLG